MATYNDCIEPLILQLLLPQLLAVALPLEILPTPRARDSFEQYRGVIVPYARQQSASDWKSIDKKIRIAKQEIPFASKVRHPELPFSCCPSSKSHAHSKGGTTIVPELLTRSKELMPRWRQKYFDRGSKVN